MSTPEATSDASSNSSDLVAAAGLRKALRRFHNQSSQILRQHGLTSERYELLLAIHAAHQAQQPATITELSRELELARSSLTQLVRRSQDAGLVAREVSAEDARVRYLTLTQTGAGLVVSAAAQLRPERQRLLDLLYAPEP